jgi:two-component system response regulator FixJ
LIQTLYVVDDDDAVRDSLQGLLELHSYEIEAFASGQEFLKRYTPDIEGCLILDINLPGLDGFEVLGRLGPPRAELPVIMITAQDDQAIESRALDAGATALIRKPFAADRLLALVRSALGQRVDAR